MSDFFLQILNGEWSIAAAALSIICAIYLVHEGRAYHIMAVGGRARLTRSMRVMLGIFTLSVGVCLRSVAVMAWRMSGGDLRDLSNTWLLVGAVIALVGFLCTIREISKPLYGNAPWLLTLLAMAVYTMAAVGWRLH